MHGLNSIPSRYRDASLDDQCAWVSRRVDAHAQEALSKAKRAIYLHAAHQSVSLEIACGISLNRFRSGSADRWIGESWLR